MIAQHLPAPVSPQIFDNDQALLLDLLSKQGIDPGQYCNAPGLYNPYPIALPTGDFAIERRLQELLYAAIVGIVTNFFTDERLQELYRLPDTAAELLRSIHDIPYRPGSYRPDFLHDTAGNIKICEINARFPANAYFITQYIKNVIPKLSYLERIYDAKLSPDTADACLPFLNRFPRGSCISIVKDSERGLDVHYLKHQLNQAGYQCQFKNSSQLGDILSAADCMILELHQRELLKPENTQIIAQCAQRLSYFNDLRTILIVHDKRFLAALCRQDIMADYLGQDAAIWLQEHVVPTFAIRGSEVLIVDALRNQSNWVLKPNLFGKGEGIVVGRSVSTSAWQNALRQSMYSDYVLQPYIKQMKFPILAKHEGEVAIFNLNVVGTMLCFDQSFLGPGIYRAAAGDILSIVGGGSILFPIVTNK